MVAVSLKKKKKKFFFFFFQAEDGIRDTELWLEFRRVLFRSDDKNLGHNFHIDEDDDADALADLKRWAYH